MTASVASITKYAVVIALLSMPATPSLSQSAAPDATSRKAGTQVQPRSRDAIYSVGETVPEDAKMVGSYPGLDLPSLGKSEGYVRSNEHVYRVNRKTRKVLDVVSLSDVLLM